MRSFGHRLQPRTLAQAVEAAVIFSTAVRRTMRVELCRDPRCWHLARHYLIKSAGRPFGVPKAIEQRVRASGAIGPVRFVHVPPASRCIITHSGEPCVTPEDIARVHSVPEDMVR